MSAAGLGGRTYGAVVGDTFAGFTSALVMLPLALAYGVATGLGPQAGLYGALALGLTGFLLGGTRTMIFGPSAVAKSLTGFGILRDVPSQCRVATIDQARELARTLLEDNSTEHTA